MRPATSHRKRELELWTREPPGQRRRINGGTGQCWVGPVCRLPCYLQKACMKTAPSASREAGERFIGCRHGAQALPGQSLFTLPTSRSDSWAKTARAQHRASRPVEHDKHGSPGPGCCCTIQYMRQQPVPIGRAQLCLARGRDGSASASAGTSARVSGTPRHAACASAPLAAVTAGGLQARSHDG